ncbi:ATP synthase subunit C [Thermanaerovibrio velox DSM 12556]|uniref:ATP synthase subunit C n=1 Tax=Thermanaerovibrio velox DSM 12556 TaxID=926567 RepID=H0UNC5_9BACT|nr:ATP synthase subunit C [Thermanaerovibrio velox]EHM10410.1 ATP synthase subunit C [Thermanaerovibrio velox DSM 12556]
MLGLMICCFTVGTMLLAGYGLKGKRVSNPRGILGAAILVSGALMLLGVTLSLSGSAWASEGAPKAAGALGASGLGFIGASLSTGLACLGAGVAVSGVGAAALGLVGEKPQMLGTTLIYLGLAEGIAIYGVIVSLLIMGKM